MPPTSLEVNALFSENLANPHRVSDDSDDEIVWCLSDGETSVSGSTPVEYVILSRPRTPEDQLRSVRGPQTHTPVTASETLSLSAKMGAMNISKESTTPNKKKKKKKVKPVVVRDGNNTPPDTPSKKQRRKKAKNKPATAVATPIIPYPSPASSPKIKKTRKPAPSSQAAEAKADGTRTGLEGRSVVNDIPDKLSVVSHESAWAPTLYDEASTFISRFISSSDAKRDSVCKLTLLQSLIVELGLATRNLPASLRSARNVLKSHAFLNVREYIAVRGEGPEAIRQVMFPSRSALIKNIRKNPKNRAPLRWVKDMGLQVLLVGWAH